MACLTNVAVCGLIETWGRGTLKIAGLMRQAGLPEPTLQERGGFVTMTFVLSVYMVARTSGDGETPGKSSDKSSEKIIRHLRAEPTLSAKVLAEKMGVSSRTVEKQINILKKEGRLRRVGPAKGGRWEVIG